MAIRKLRESKTLKNYEIADMLVANGFDDEEEGYLDYFLPDNPKYVASVNLDDMGSYIDDLDEGEQISLPYANNADRKILRTEEDVEEFLSFIQELNYSDMFESKTRKVRNRVTESLDVNNVIKKVKKLRISESGTVYYTDMLDDIKDSLKRQFPELIVDMVSKPQRAVRVKSEKVLDDGNTLFETFYIIEGSDGRIKALREHDKPVVFVSVDGAINFFYDYLNS